MLRASAMKWSFWNADQEDWMRWRLASLGYPYPNNLTSTSQLSTLQDRIFYAMFSMKSKNKNSCRLEFNLLSLQLVPTTAKETITKYILLSLVGKFKQSFLASIFYWSFTRTTGPEVKPLQKARSGGQRNEIQEFIKKVLFTHPVDLWANALRRWCPSMRTINLVVPTSWLRLPSSQSLLEGKPSKSSLYPE